MIDKGLHFGIQNYFNVGIDEGDATDNYYAFMDRKGAILLMKTNKSGGEGRYRVSTGTLSDKFNLTTFPQRIGDYYLPNQLEDVQI